MLLGLSLTSWGNPVDQEQEIEDPAESILNQELATTQEGQAQFDHLVESTMDVMGPDLNELGTVEQ